MSFLSLSLCLSLLSFTTCVYGLCEGAQTQPVAWTVKPVSKPDTRFPRFPGAPPPPPYQYLSVSDNPSISDKWPADAIIVNFCTILDLTVDNQSGDDLTLRMCPSHHHHDGPNLALDFHGILQHDGQTLMDGAQGLSQTYVLYLRLLHIS